MLSGFFPWHSFDPIKKQPQTNISLQPPSVQVKLCSREMAKQERGGHLWLRAWPCFGLTRMTRTFQHIMSPAHLLCPRIVLQASRARSQPRFLCTPLHNRQWSVTFKQSLIGDVEVGGAGPPPPHRRKAPNSFHTDSLWSASPSVQTEWSWRKLKKNQISV